MTDIELAVLADYKRKYDLLFNLCFEYRNNEDIVFYNVLLKKAARLNLLIDFMEKNDGITKSFVKLNGPQ